MKNPVIVIGIGEMGAVFARGFLCLGHPVYPVTRQESIRQLALEVVEPEAVLIAVGEKELSGVLQQLPTEWRDRVCLLQNELLPDDWDGIEEPTVISVWFEKKPGMDSRVIIPSPVYGPHARLLADALASIDIPTRILHNPDELLFELVVKNVYILTTNIAGLKTGGTVSELWNEQREFASAVAADVITLQEALTETYFDRDKLIAAVVSAFEGDPSHRCMGRNAPARLERALQHAEQRGLRLEILQEIAEDIAE